MAEEKVKKTKKRKTTEKTDVLPDGSVLDIKNYDWGEFDSLRNITKAFVIWYTLPGQNGFRNATVAAKKAGYTKASAYKMNYQIGKEEKIRNCIKMFEDRMVKTSIEDAYHKVVQEKIKRATYNIKDFYETIEVTNPDTGDTYNRIVTKRLEDISEENSTIIDNVEINQSGIASYKLPNKEREQTEIIKTFKDMFQEKSTGDYDVETTVETIRDTLDKNKLTVRVTNRKVRENAENYIENSDNQPDFD